MVDHWIINLWVMVVYASFIVDFYIWPIPSEVSTVSMLKKDDQPLRMYSLLLIICHALILLLWILPLWISASSLFTGSLFSDETNRATTLQWLGICITLAGRMLTIGASATLNKNSSPTLIKHSVFAYSRHPVVTGLHLTSAGLLLTTQLPVLLPLYLIALFYFDHKIRLEEKNLITTWGDEYLRYRESTPRYLLI